MLTHDFHELGPAVWRALALGNIHPPTPAPMSSSLREESARLTLAPEPTAAPRARLTLYDATAELAAAYELLEESEGEWTPEIEELLNHATGQFHEKAERVALFIRERESSAATTRAMAEALLAGIAPEVERLRARAAREEKMAEGLLGYLKRWMEAAGVPKVEGKLISPTIQKCAPKLVGEVDAVALWDMQDLEEGAPSWRHLIRHKVTESHALDRVAALKALKAGEPVPAGLAMVTETKLVLK